MRPDKASRPFPCPPSLSADAARLITSPADALLTVAAMYASRAALFVSLLSTLVTLAVTQSNGTFCNRIYHSSIIVNDKLYVDGGELRTVRQPKLGLFLVHCAFVLTWPGDKRQCIRLDPKHRCYHRSFETFQQCRSFDMGTNIQGRRHICFQRSHSERWQHFLRRCQSVSLWRCN